MDDASSRPVETAYGAEVIDPSSDERPREGETGLMRRPEGLRGPAVSVLGLEHEGESDGCSVAPVPALGASRLSVGVLPEHRRCPGLIASDDCVGCLRDQLEDAREGTGCLDRECVTSPSSEAVVALSPSHAVLVASSSVDSVYRYSSTPS